jgi:hypothetical protein
MKKFLLLLTIALSVSLAFADITGSTITTSTTEILSNSTLDVNFSLVYYSDDYEFLDGVSLDFPTGVIVNSATDIGDLDYNQETGDGVLISWGSITNHSGFGSQNDDANFNVNITISSDFTTDLEIPFFINGDGLGADPHTISGNLIIQNSGGGQVPELNITLNSTSGLDNKVELNWTKEGLSQTVLDENFDNLYDADLVIPNWTLIDQDQGTTIEYIDQHYHFPHPNEAFAWTITNWDRANVSSHSPQNSISAIANLNDVQNHDWLISPEIDFTESSNFVDGELTFWANPVGAGLSNDPEHLKILISTTGTEISDFNEIANLELTDKDVWRKITLPLSNYIGNSFHIAFQYCSTGNVVLTLDDIKVKGFTNIINNYKVYRSENENSDFTLIATTDNMSYTDYNIVPDQQYFYKVSAIIDSIYESQPSNTASATPTGYSISELPFVENFDELEAPVLPQGAIIENSNNDDKTWFVNNGGANSEPNCLKYAYSSENAADDWFFLAPVEMQENVQYNISFNYRANSTLFPEKMDFYVGRIAGSQNMQTQLFTNENINFTTYENVAINFIPEESGRYVFGWHVDSDADMAALYVDDIHIELSPTQPIIGLNKSEINYDEVMFTQSKIDSFTIKNIGVNTLNVTSVTSDSDEFILSPITLPASLSDNDSLVVYVNFVPQIEGDITGTITVQDENNTSAIVNLSGSGVNATLVPDFVQTFENAPAGSFFPENWKIYKGLLVENSNLEEANECWSTDDFANIETDPVNKAANILLSGSYIKHWLITPPINLGNSTNYQIELDAALTQIYTNEPAQLSPDDKVCVVISTDNGQTWSSNNILYEWNSQNQESNLSTHHIIDLSDYSGFVQIGFYGESTVDNGAKMFYLDNFGIFETGHTTTVEPPICDLESGEYDGQQTIHLTSATLGANIHYTLDGTIPNEQSLVYSDSLIITSSTVLKAVAMKPNMGNSEIFEANFTINIVNNSENNNVSLTQLNGNYPNPFNPETTISYQLKNPGFVNITIYNMKGEKVCTLVNEMKSSGHYLKKWTAKNNRGKSISSGIYFYKFSVDGKNYSIKKCLLLK